MVVDTDVAREQEELLAQMEESREALAHKIELLEGKVTETVENATASMAEATANVLETVQTATASVSETVGSVSEAVQGTVDTVRSSVHDGMESVKGAFDLTRQVQKHPWWMLGGAIAAGYLAGRYLQPSGNAKRRKDELPRPGEFAPLTAHSVPEYPFSRPAMNGSGMMPNGISVSLPNPEAAANTLTGSREPSSSQPSSTWSKISETLAPEIAKLKGLAIGTALGLVRDSIVNATPDPMKKTLSDVIDDVTEKLGGERLHGSLLSSEPDSVSRLDSLSSIPR